MVVFSEILADTLSLSVTIDTKAIPVTSLQYNAALNKSRKVRFTVVGDDLVQLCNLGSEVIISAGRDRAISNLNFTGIIREVNPNNEGAEIIAMDYITLLITSDFVNYKDEDILGREPIKPIKSLLSKNVVDKTTTPAFTLL